ncbi:TMV resistance protein N-like isoform X1 [Cucurbita moschata]|uniref:TMV resistance protein N-like isoform X1 n=1 Tax=Cucurbita moschata TaxID=3662 RepID=A0A6J1FX23_CUCMO|nr:TMV resistance protein N-like isoform X1 [Cucurbita moschata]
MNRVAAVAKITPRLFLAQLGSKQLQRGIAKPCDVFINHRGVDTKKTVAALLYDRLIRGNFRPFLDYRNLKPGEKLFDELHGAIRQCKVGVAVFSPRYCESYFCLHELAMIIESNKKVIPIFCDVNPSQLGIKEEDGYETEDLRRFNWALEQAKQLEGIKFNSSKQTLSDVVTRASNIVISSLVEMDGRDEQ